MVDVVERELNIFDFDRLPAVTGGRRRARNRHTLQCASAHDASVHAHPRFQDRHGAGSRRHGRACSVRVHNDTVSQKPTDTGIHHNFSDACSIGYIRPFAHAPPRSAVPEPARTRSVVTGYQTGSRSTLSPTLPPFLSPHRETPTRRSATTWTPRNSLLS